MLGKFEVDEKTVAKQKEILEKLEHTLNFHTEKKNIMMMDLYTNKVQKQKERIKQLEMEVEEQKGVTFLTEQWKVALKQAYIEMALQTHDKEWFKELVD